MNSTERKIFWQNRALFSNGSNDQALISFSNIFKRRRNTKDSKEGPNLIKSFCSKTVGDE